MKTRAFSGAPMDHLGMLALSVVAGSFCLMITSGDSLRPSGSHGKPYYMAWFLGAFALWQLACLVRAHRTLVQMDHVGLQDHRIFRGTIPWEVMQSVSVLKHRHYKYLCIRLRPEAGYKVKYKPLASLKMVAFSRGVQVPAFGVKASAQELMQAARAASAEADSPLRTTS